MEHTKRKAINFDLDTAKMKDLGSYPNGYQQLEKSFKKYGFIHRQGSGYNSIKGMTESDIQYVVKQVVQENPWLAECVKKIDVTDIGRQHDLTAVVKRFAKVGQNVSGKQGKSTEKRLTPKDETLISAIRASKAGVEFDRLYSGREKSDKKLMAIIQLYTCDDYAATERIFQSSALYDAGKGATYVKQLFNAASVSRRSIKNANAAAVSSKGKGNAR